LSHLAEYVPLREILGVIQLATLVLLPELIRSHAKARLETAQLLVETRQVCLVTSDLPVDDFAERVVLETISVP
jgi:hypothetical protein